MDTKGVFSLSVKWTKPSGVFDNYLIDWRRSGGNYNDDNQQLVDKLQTRSDITGLKQAQKYYVRIRTISNNVESEVSDHVKITTS